MAAMRASIHSLQSRLQAMKDKEPVDSSQAAKDGYCKSVLRKGFSDSDSSSPRRGWSSLSKSRPLKRAWKPPVGDALDSSPEPFPEYSPAQKKRAPDSSLEGVSSKTKEVLVGLQEQLSALVGVLSKGSSRKKDDSLPIKSSVKRAAASLRSGLSKRPSPERYSSPAKPSTSYASAHHGHTSSPVRPSSDRNRISSSKRPSRSLSRGTSASPDRRQEPENLLYSDISRPSHERILSSRLPGRDESPSPYRHRERLFSGSSRLRSPSRRSSRDGRSSPYKRLESKRLPDPSRDKRE
ncbi:BUD13 homolog [Macrobrachium nipponense]|uniref:BUD13 homolog n=1 Tax=Macrobrachium nipponense TaxID=159736 RepID=UPI0030C8A0DA